MRVQLVKRWGAHQPGLTVTVDQVMGQWLLGHGVGVLAQAKPQPQASSAPPVTPDVDSTSGDATPAPEAAPESRTSASSTRKTPVRKAPAARTTRRASKAEPKQS